MHDDNVISSPKYANFQVGSKICLIFLLHFPFMLYSSNDLLHVVVVVVVVYCMLCFFFEVFHLYGFVTVYMNHAFLLPCFQRHHV